MESIKEFFEKLGIDNIINIIGHILTIISLFLVFLTLLEMQIQRNNAYMPQIVAECNDAIDIKWNNKLDLVSLNGNENDGYIYAPIELEIYNIGVGVAKNLSFEWTDDNLVQLGEYINDNSVNFNANTEHGMLSINADDFEAGSGGFEQNNYLNFIMSSNEEPYKIDFPQQYLMCYKVMLIDQLKEIPTVQLKISYEDIQGKVYEQIVSTKIKTTSLFSSSGNKNEDFVGNARLELIVR